MTKTLTTIVALIIWGAALTANADMMIHQTADVLEGYGTFSSNLSDTNFDSLNGGWTVASLFTYRTNGTTSQNRSYESYARAVLDSFQDGWDASGNSIVYGDVKQIAAKDLSTTDGAGKHLDWLTTPNTNKNGEGLNGFYAFNYTFDFAAINEIGNYDNLNVILNLSFGADDHIEGVYLNGKSIFEYLPGYGTENWKETTLLRDIFDATDMAMTGGIFAEGNELVFIVHNDGHNGSSFGDGSNAFGFGEGGYIAISADKNFDPTNTPEPATILIIGLGLAGLGIRRRFAK